MAYRENDSQRRSAPVRFDLMERIGVLSMKDSGWTREVNLVSWNGAPAKVDIREWNPDHSRMSRGITLFEEEAETLTKALARRYGLRLTDRGPARREFFNEKSNRQFFNEEQSAEEPAGSAYDVSGNEAETAAPVAEIAAACVAECAACM